MVMNPQHRNNSRSGSASADTAALERRLAECGEISHVLLERLPTLTDIVVATSRKTRADIRHRLTECETALAAESDALHAARRVIPAAESRNLSQSLQRRKEDLADLTSRAEELFACDDTLPVHVPIASKAQIAELLTGMHEYRKVFWRALYEVPGVQRFAVERLRRIGFESRKLLPSSVLHIEKVGEPDEEALFRDVTKVLGQCDVVMAQSASEIAQSERLSAIATLLTQVPLDATVLSELLIRFRSKANQLADLEIALQCHDSMSGSSVARADPTFAKWSELAAEFDGGAFVARATVARLEKAQEPYVRIKQYLTTANIPFVKKLINRVQKYEGHADDMVQEGAMGFMRALDKFDLTSGYSLLTYAGWWVMQGASGGFADQVGTIYVPREVQRKLAKLSTGMSGVRQVDSEAAAREIGMTPDTLAALLPLMRGIASFSSRIRGTERTVGDTISTPGGGEFVIDEYPHECEVRREGLSSALKKLSGREREILVQRFGLDGKGVRTLDDVGLEMGLSRERIRQIQDRALKRLREGAARAGLHQLWEDIES